MALYRPRPVFQLRADADHPAGSKLRSKNCDPSAAATLVDYVTCGRRKASRMMLVRMGRADRW